MIRTTFEGEVATLVLDRPPLNILDLAGLEELETEAADLALQVAHQDGAGTGKELRLVVVRGTGQRAFSAGVAVQDHTPDKIERMLGHLHKAIRTLRALPIPTVALVRGHCLGGGFELALACDFLLAADDATFGLPEVGLGCFPPVAAALLPPRLGTSRALDLILTGRLFPCEEAKSLGLVTRSAPPGDLEATLYEFQNQLIAGSAAVARLIKKAVAAGAERPFPEALAETERIYLEELAPLEDLEEGLAAFLEKRPVRWRHG